MAGRGRGTTLPAWMTNPESADLKPPAAAAAAAAAAPSSSSSAEQFSDAVVADSLIEKTEGPPRVFTPPPTTGPQKVGAISAIAGLPRGPPSFSQPPQFNAPPQFSAPPQFQAPPQYAQQYPPQQQYPGYQQYPGMPPGGIPQYPHPMGGMHMGGPMGGYGGPRPIGGPMAAAPRAAPTPAVQVGDPTNDVASWREQISVSTGTIKY
jgi:hypothetical protein